MTGQALLFIHERRRWVCCPDRPKRLAVLIPAASPVTIPNSMRRGLGTFIEDEGHDWTWNNGRLRYHGTETPPCWVLIEFP